MRSSIPQIPVEITVSAPIRATSGLRDLVWSIAGSNVVHAAVLGVASVVPMGTATWMLSAVPYHLHSGENTVQITATFMDAAAARRLLDAGMTEAATPMEVLAPREGPSELAPRVVEMSPLGSLPAPQGAAPDGESLQAAKARSEPSAMTKQSTTADHPPEPHLTFALPPRELASPLPAETASTPSQATAAVASPPASGAKADQLPSEILNPFPAYPPELLARRIEGTVILRLRIAAEGTIAEATVHRTSGYEALDQAALAAVRGWKFRPAVKDGKNIESVLRKPFQFVIEER